MGRMDEFSMADPGYVGQRIVPVVYMTDAICAGAKVGGSNRVGSGLLHPACLSPNEEIRERAINLPDLDQKCDGTRINTLPGAVVGGIEGVTPPQALSGATIPLRGDPQAHSAVWSVSGRSQTKPLAQTAIHIAILVAVNILLVAAHNVAELARPAFWPTSRKAISSLRELLT